jgi:hypothetical protein
MKTYGADFHLVHLHSLTLTVRFTSKANSRLPLCNLLVIAALLTAGQAMAAQFITNGGFELPVRTYAAITSLPGWYVSDNIDIQSYSAGGWPAYEGDQSIDLSRCATNGAYIEQAFPLHQVPAAQPSWLLGKERDFQRNGLRMVPSELRMAKRTGASREGH